MNKIAELVQCVADGFEFEVSSGTTLMVALKTTGFDIEASCEGSLACGTCHVRLLQGWASRVPAPKADEQAMLDSLSGATSASRLSCQILVTSELSGLSLEIPR
jgi:ferredoxin